MNEFAAIDFKNLLEGQGVAAAIIDVALVTFFVYRLLVLVRGTRGWRILVGIGAYALVFFAAKALGLRTLFAILQSGVNLYPVALVILFLPELRQAIESFGRLDRFGAIGSRLDRFGLLEDIRTEAQTVEQIVAAVTELAAMRIGALIVLETGPPLTEIASNGVSLDANVSAPLLGSIFYENNPLHDGAVIISRDRIVAAAARLPLSDSARIDPHVHMRHRAAVGITEAIECLCIVVSEERGTISYAWNGELFKVGGPNELWEVLNSRLRSFLAPKSANRRRKPKVTVD